MSLLEEVNARVAAKNAEILAARIAVYDKIDGSGSATTWNSPMARPSASPTIGATGSSL
jgi:hypothetical protein